MRRYAIKDRVLLTKFVMKILKDKIMLSSEYRKRHRWPVKAKPYALFLCSDNDVFLLIEDIDWERGVILGKISEGSEYAQDVEMSIPEAFKFRLQIEHTISNRTIVFTTPLKFLFNQITRLKYIRNNISIRKAKKEKIKFGKTNLILKSRMEVLKYLVENYCKGNDTLTSQQIMSATVSNRWVFHPESKHKHKRLSLLLGSLVSSGDLILEKNNHYNVTPQSIETLEKHRDNNLKHQQAIVLQESMLLVTAILAIFTVIQSDLIKFATIIDLEKHKAITFFILVSLLIIARFAVKSHNKAFKRN